MAEFVFKTREEFKQHVQLCGNEPRNYKILEEQTNTQELTTAPEEQQPERGQPGRLAQRVAHPLRGDVAARGAVRVRLHRSRVLALQPGEAGGGAGADHEAAALLGPAQDVGARKVQRAGGALRRALGPLP